MSISRAPPDRPVGDDADDKITVKIYMEDRKAWKEESKNLDDALHSFFTILWGQCSPGVQGTITSKYDFLIKKEIGDCAWLLKEIRQVMFDLSSSKNPVRSLFKEKLKLLRFKQGRDISVIDYHKKFNELLG